LNPNTRTCPIFCSSGDAELTKAIYRRVPVLIREARDGQLEENPWGIKFSTMFHMSNDSHLFRTREQLEADGWTLDGNVFRRTERRANDNSQMEEYLPLYEGRFGHQFNHRFASQPKGDLTEFPLEALKRPSTFVEPQYWISFPETTSFLDKKVTACRTGLLGFRRVARDTDERTCIAAVIPWGAASYGWILTLGPSALNLGILNGIYNSFPFDYLLRSSLSQPSIPQGSFEQIPAIPEGQFYKPCLWAGSETSDQVLSNTHHSPRSLSAFLLPRVLELTYTAWDLEPFARDCDYSGPPFRWDEERRFFLRAELDAAFFHLYLLADNNGDWVPARKSDGCPHEESPEDLSRLKTSFPKPRDAVSDIMDTFPIVRRKDEEKYNGDYRTKRVILEIYDAMQDAIRTGQPYQTRLDPPPGPPPTGLPDRKPGEPQPANWPPHIHSPKDVSKSK
jgi:hypothetical protein